MIKKIVLLIFLFKFKLILAQNTTIISFEERVIVSKEMLENAPPMLRDLLKKQLNNTIFLSKVHFKDNIIYYSSYETDNQTNVNGKIAKKGNTTYSDSETIIKTKSVKLKKDFLKQNYTTLSQNKLTAKPLEKVKWVVSKKTKKILNYNCFLATTTFKGQKLEVYYTKEIAGSATPEKLPYINGVVLEYRTPTKTCIATQVQLNQPNVKNFFD
jgi:GLPGLI family protein